MRTAAPPRCFRWRCGWRAAESQHTEAADRAAAHVDAVCALLDVSADEVEAHVLEAATTRLNEERAVAESWLPRERQLTDERTRLRALDSEAARLATVVGRHDKRAADLADAHARVTAALGAATPIAGRAAADRAALETAETGLEAASEAAQLAAELDDARSRLTVATTHVQDLRQTYLDLRERRISGMAAELAGALAVGCSCPVCGSVDHPAPARASVSVSRADEDAAREHYESADFERQTVQELVTTLATRLESVLQRSQGQSVTHWRTTAGAAASAAAESSRAERDESRLGAELADLEKERTAVLTELASTRVSLEERTRQQTEASERHERLLAERDALLADHPGVTTVAALLAAHRRAVAELDEARAATTALDRAAHELKQATAAADSAASEAGFSSLADALAAVLPGGEAVAQARQLDQRSARRAAADSVLAEEAVRAALEETEPDLTGLAAQVAESSRLRDEQHAAHEQAGLRVQRLQALTDELAEALAAWRPVRAEHTLTAGLAALVEGKSADNQLRMRLSAYVLSERLRQVVAAANERLGGMTDQRFTLEQADERGAGEQRGGLSLRVRDEWSGKQRDPATLSGGETFIVSLALALGLADTVSHEAGGTQLDTLFIDEGFGALDAGTLDGVMDTLDSLRDGGRVVGLVSHVAELRNRVPAQLEVRKARCGSTVRASVVAS